MLKLMKYFQRKINRERERERERERDFRVCLYVH